MRHARNYYVFSPESDRTGFDDIHFEAWDEHDAMSRAEAMILRNQTYTISRNGVFTASVSLTEEGVWTEVRVLD